MSVISKNINIGIVAHVDAGKTSITEQMLVVGGALTAAGSVDKGTSQTDWLSVEKERGISIRTATVSFVWNNTSINIIDTPGHVDFSSEVQRSFPAMDCVILVVSAVEGVQGHTLTLWNAIAKSNLPCIIYINKTDRAGSDHQDVLINLKKEFSTELLPLNSILNEGSNDINIDSNTDLSDVDNFIAYQKDIIINGDDNLIELYINETHITNQQINNSLISQVKEKQLIPVLFGSAKFNIGTKELLNAITNLIVVPAGDIKKPVSGIVYKVEHDAKIGKVASVRLFDGILKNRDIVDIAGKQEKITQIRKSQGPKFIDVGEISAGDTAAICGLTSVRAGDYIGNDQNVIKDIQFATSVLTVKVIPGKEEDYSNLVSAMQILADEDPNLDMLWLKDEREIHIKIMGIIQLQILKSIVNERFNIDITFGKPTVIYKETPANSFIAFEEYTMPKPCWAVVRFEIEPLPLGSGIQFKSKVGVNKIAIQYQQEVERSLSEALKQGIHGWEVTDIKITLIGDEDHNIHSRAGDFAVATAMALMKGFSKNPTTLLEPMLEYKIVAPEENLGSIISELTQNRANFGSPEIIVDKCIVSGTIPVSTSLNFPTTITSLTKGKGNLTTSFAGYKYCLLELGETTPYRGVNPLERAKYILKARGAIN